MMLPVCLWSIAGQNHRSYNVYVADNAVDDKIAAMHRRAVEYMDTFAELKGKFHYVRTAGKTKVNDCYWSAEYVIDNHPVGRWLTFPCDDVYYMPEFAQRMLSHAFREQADYVFTRWLVVGPEACGTSAIPEGGYRIIEVRLHKTPKTCFIVNRSVYKGFAFKQAGFSGPINADYFFSSQMVNDKVAISRLDDLLVIHN